MISYWNLPRLSAVDHLALGDLDAGIDSDFEIGVFNSGGAVLRIFGVETSCGCVAVQQGEMLINPGEQKPLRFRLKAQLEIGAHQVRVAYKTNDTKHPTASCLITYSSRQLFQMVPERAAFFPGDPFEKTITLHTDDELPPLVKLSAVADIPLVEMEVERIGPHDARILVRLKEPIVQGEFDIPIHLNVLLENGTNLRSILRACGAVRKIDQVKPSVIVISGPEGALELQLPSNPSAALALSTFGLARSLDVKQIANSKLAVSWDQLSSALQEGLILIETPGNRTTIPVYYYKPN